MQLYQKEITLYFITLYFIKYIIILIKFLVFSFWYFLFGKVHNRMNKISESNKELLKEYNHKKNKKRNIIISTVICTCIILIIIILSVVLTKCPTYLQNTTDNTCCKSNSGIGYYDLSSNKCANCNNGYKYNKTSKQCISSSSSQPQYQQVPDCSGTNYYNSSTKTCCPSGQYYISGTTCNTCSQTSTVSNSTGTEFSTFYEQCIPICNTGYYYQQNQQTEMCIPICDDYLYNNYTNTCCNSLNGAGYYNNVTGCTSCSSGYIYNSTESICNPICNTGYIYNDNECQPVCTESYLYNSVANTCCSDLDYYNTIDLSCETCKNTFSDSSGVIYNDAYSMCAPICVSGYQLSFLTSTNASTNASTITPYCEIACEYPDLINYSKNTCCNSSNGAGYYNLTDLSCEVCPNKTLTSYSSGQVYSSLWGGCIPACNSGYIYNGTSCTQADCSGNPVAYNYISGKCCTGINAYYDEVSNTCGNCNSGTYSNVNGACNNTSCPPGYTFNDYYITCEMDCSNYLFTGSKCCDSSNGTGYYNKTTNSCETCTTPGDIYYPSGEDGYYGTCDPVCGPGYYLDNTTSSCYPIGYKCPNNSPANETTYTVISPSEYTCCTNGVCCPNGDCS